jgi:hypothetical protein
MSCSTPSSPSSPLLVSQRCRCYPVQCRPPPLTCPLSPFTASQRTRRRSLTDSHLHRPIKATILPIGEDLPLHRVIALPSCHCSESRHHAEGCRRPRSRVAAARGRTPHVSTSSTLAASRGLLFPLGWCGYEPPALHYPSEPRALCAAMLPGIGLVAIPIFQIFQFRFEYAANFKNL